MKLIIISLFITCIFFYFKNADTTIVSTTFADSLMNNYTTPLAVKNNQADMQFWKNRISGNTPDYSNTLKYASTLIGRFHLLGDIKDVKLADSLLLKTAQD